MATHGPDAGDVQILLGEFDRLRRRIVDAEQRFSRLRLVEKRLQTAERRFLSLLDNVRMFAIGLDRTGKISYANNFFLEIAGYDLDSIRGEDWLAKFVPDSHRDLIAPLLQEMLQTGLTPSFEHPFVTREGRERVVAWSGGWQFHEDGGISVRISLGADVTEQRRAESALRQSEHRYRAIVEDQTELVCRLDETGRLTFANNAASQFYDEPREELAGRSFLELCLSTDMQRAASVLESLTRSKPVRSIELRAEPTTGEMRWLQWTCRLLEPGPGEGREYQIVGRDITERRRAEEEMQRATRELERSLEHQKRLGQELDAARERAENAAEAKSRFLAHMSHEIRTPMNGVIGGIHLMLDSGLDEQQAEMMEIVQSSAESLLGLINEILDFSKIEAGKLELERLPVSVRSLVEDVTTMLAPQAYGKGLELVSLVHADVPGTLIGDPARLRQVLTNLVANATKFTDNGDVVIRVLSESAEEGSNTLRFEVADTGIGIPAERIDRLFKSFSQVDSSTTRRHGGTGLGLAISKALVEMMGGEVGVESEYGTGSTFWFRVPLGVADESMVEPPPEDAVRLEGRRILVADAHTLTRQAIVSRLAAEGCVCVEVSRVDRALDAIREAKGPKKKFDLLILGASLDDGTSEELGRSVRTTFRRRRVPMLMLTPCGLRGDTTRLEEIGFDAYLTKPVRSSQLMRCLASVLGRKTRRRKSPKRILTRFNVPERERATILVVEDIPVNQKVAVRMLERLGHKAEVAANGREALEALRQHRYDLVLMDCQMPGMDGFEATRAIRAMDGPVADVPIIALTANAIMGDRQRCIDAGMTDYLSKPIAPAELKALVEKLLEPAVAPA